MHDQPFRCATCACVIATLLLMGAPSSALGAPEARIDQVRVGRHPGYTRIVFEVPSGTRSYTTQSPTELHIEAAPPSLDGAILQRLREVGVRLERSREGTRMRLDSQPGRTWSAFQLETESLRIVVDLGSGLPGVPPDAERVPERPAQVRSERSVAPAATAEPDTTLRVTVNGIRFSGLPADGPGPEELLDVAFPVERAADGAWKLVAAGDAAELLRLRDLSSANLPPATLTASVLQQIVESIAAVYAQRGLVGTRVDIRRRDLDALAKDVGPLVVHVTPARLGYDSDLE